MGAWEYVDTSIPPQKKTVYKGPDFKIGRLTFINPKDQNGNTISVDLGNGYENYLQVETNKGYLDVILPIGSWREVMVAGARFGESTKLNMEAFDVQRKSLKIHKDPKWDPNYEVKYVKAESDSGILTLRFRGSESALLKIAWKE